MTGTVRYEIREAIARITFDRPGARNAMSWAMYDQLAECLTSIEADPAVRVTELRGSGGHFVSGTDITQFESFSSGDDGVAYEARLETILRQLESLRIPTVAVVQGYAAGAGLLFAAACDIRICTPDAMFSAPIARTVGNTLSLASVARLVAHLGASRTKWLLMTAGALWYLSLYGPLRIHMVVATIAGVFSSVLLGCGLFAAAFYSDKSGYDRNVTDATRARKPDEGDEP